MGPRWVIPLLVTVGRSYAYPRLCAVAFDGDSRSQVIASRSDVKLPHLTPTMPPGAEVIKHRTNCMLRQGDIK